MLGDTKGFGVAFVSLRAKRAILFFRVLFFYNSVVLFVSLCWLTSILDCGIMFLQSNYRRLYV